MNIRQLIAQLMVLGVFNLSVVSETGQLQGAISQADLKQRVQQFGVGTELKLKLKSGEKIRGSVESITEDGFTVTSKKDGTPHQISYSDLANANYPKRGYKTDGTPDATAAKRMVVELGTSEHIMVKVSPTEKVRGVISAIHDDHFVITPDGATATREVAYSSIQKVNKNLSAGATIAILVAIAATVVLILVLTGEEDVDVLPD